MIEIDHMHITIFILKVKKGNVSSGLVEVSAIPFWSHED